MKILVTGSSGLIGTALTRALRDAGHTAVPLARPGRPVGPGEARWDPASGELDRSAAEGAEAVVNLVGASIAEGRWNETRKQVLRTSRVDATRGLVLAFSKLSSRPRVLVSASAVGYFGNRGDALLTEESAPGDDFLARLTRDWEAEAFRAQSSGIRTVVLRFGVVLASGGGALAKMLTPFRLGLGGRMGSGKQWMSWLTVTEAARIIRQAIERPAWSGTFNAVTPNPATNAEFTRVLGRVLGRPTLFPAPAFALRLALGEMADALLLASQRVQPKRLQESGYSFEAAELEPALRTLLGERS